MHPFLASPGELSGRSMKSRNNSAIDAPPEPPLESDRTSGLKFRRWGILWMSILMCIVPLCRGVRGQTTAGDWPTYGHDPGGERFSRLKQIDRRNVGQLQRAWTYTVPVFPGSGVAAFENTPLMVGDVLYFAVPTGQAIAVDAETGKQLWVFDPFQGVSVRPNPVPNRGVAYWKQKATAAGGTKQNRLGSRIFYVSSNARLYGIDSATGKLCRDFGSGGSINLREGIATRWPKLQYGDTSPPVIYNDEVIVGSGVQEYPSLGPSGAVRAFNVHTGKLVWRFDTVPKPGEIGHDTWRGNDWVDRSGTNAWGLISVDAQNGMVFLPLGSPSYDFYGADRKGKDLFGDSLVALNAETGKLVWYYQLVHHDLWDYDLTAQPVLLTMHRSKRDIPAVAEVTKTGHVFVFDRLTGKPLFPIEERPVPQSDLPGEASWPTQPYPAMPPPLATTVVTEDDITTVTPESRKDCLQKFHSALPGGIFNPWGLKLKLEIPGTLGGGNWSGASFDPASGHLFVNTSNVGSVGMMKPQPAGAPEAYVWGSPWGAYSRFWDSNHYPCQKPPWGTLSAVDLKTGKLAWQVPLGVVDALEAKGVPKTGIYNLGGSMVTGGGLIFIGATSDHRFRAFDAQNGKELWVTRLESNAHATPLTYEGSRTKKQFVAIAVGPGGSFGDGGSGPTALAAYTLFPKGQSSPAETKLQDELRAMQARDTGGGSAPQNIDPPLPAPAQPVVFSHKRHVITVGMRCEDCHQLSADGGQMQIANVTKCMLCHRSAMTTNPEIQKLSGMDKAGQRVAWIRLYQLPTFVFFSHRKHLDAKVDCAVCHGDVRDQSVLRQQKDISMVSCVNCHQLRKASISCGLCHNVGH
ncbi:MAG: outer membrane protein assembly factor BamB family protein [Acidobacteriaceae bacterium]